MFRKINPSAGSRPGTLALPPGSPPPKIRAVVYDSDTLEEIDIDDPTRLGELRKPGKTVWIDVQGLGEEAPLRAIGAAFGLHPLVLEDAVNIPQRAKCEMHDRYLLVIARMPLAGTEGSLQSPQVCFVLGDGWLLTFQERYFGFFAPVRERIRAGNQRIRSMGPDYLLYALIDAMIDRYFPIAEELARELDELEDEVVDDPKPEALARIHKLRRELVVLRRVGWPQREAVGAMLREDNPYIREGVRVFLRDTHDHIAQIMELVDSSREMAVGLSEVYLSNISQRTNEIMKVLTLMASIFIPLTFIAGIYGMNFDYMPELTQPRAYFIVLGIMVAVAVGMVAYFRHRGWLG